MNQKVGGRDSNDEFQYSLLEINHKMSNQSVEVRKEGGRLLTFYFCMVTIVIQFQIGTYIVTKQK